MSELSKEVRDAVQGAIQLEINGRAFYNHAADATDSELAEKMFRQLAKEESYHVEAFGKLFTEVLGDKEWKKHVREEEGPGGQELIDRLEAMRSKDRTEGELEAVRIGMELERNAMAFFEGAAKVAGDSDAREIFKKIEREEKLHYDLLQTQLDSITQNGMWFDVAEIQLDGMW